MDQENTILNTAASRFQLQQVLDFVAQRVDVDRTAIDTAPLRKPTISLSLRKHGPVTDLATRIQTADSNTKASSPTQTHSAPITTMALKRKVSSEEYEENTKCVAHLFKSVVLSLTVPRRFREDISLTIVLDTSPTYHRVSKFALCSAGLKYTDDKILRTSSGWHLSMPKCDQETFALFMGYMSNNHELQDYKSLHESLLEDASAPPTHPTISIIHRSLIKLWFFASAYKMPKLQNEAMRRFLDLMVDWQIELETIRLATKGHLDECTSDDGLARPNVVQDEFLAKVVLSEVAARYMDLDLRDHYDDDWVIRIAIIPNFMRTIMLQIYSCGGKDCGHRGACYPSLLSDGERAQYMVLE
jgi:hypothetical protein